MSVTIDIRYEAGHSYRESWKLTHLYCPSCGDNSVWVDAGPGDYYEGPEHLCMSCYASFALPRGAHRSDSRENAQRITAIERASE